jgi:hypothetical protein
MCVNENMLVLLAIIFFMLSKNHENQSLPIPLILSELEKSAEG